MKVRILSRHHRLDQDSLEYLADQVRTVLGRWTHRIRETVVRIEDLNGPKGGPDLDCLVEASLIRGGRVAGRAIGGEMGLIVRMATRRVRRRLRARRHRRRALARTAAPPLV